MQSTSALIKATLSSLPFSESMLLVVGASLLTHLVFKHTETHEPLHILALLVGVPAALTPLLSHHFSPLVAGITAFLTFWTALSTSIIAYRLSPWHPLAEYPGPLLCKTSKFWLAFVSHRGKQHIYYAELHKKYGDVVRIGPNDLSIRNVAAVAPMMGPQGLPKGPFWDGRIPEAEAVKPMIAIRNHTEHTRRRRPWTRAFNSTALKGYEPIITRRCLQLVERLSEQEGVVDLAKWISYFTYDFMNDMAFGGGSEMMRDGGDVNGLWHILEAGQKNALFLSHIPWLGALFLRFPNLAKDLKEFRNHSKSCAKARKERGSDMKDLFYYLMDEEGRSATPPSDVEVINDGGLAIVAGSDTTSSSLSNLFYLLLCNPITYKRLQAEIDELGDNIMDYTRQSHMTYLNATINEALRLFPPVLSGSQRYADTARVIGEYYVPEGTSTFVPFFPLHRDSRYFSPLPDSFIPERWLQAEQQATLEPALFKDKADVILNQQAFIPFSTGPSNCVGKNLAWMEMRMLVCLVMQKFELRFEEGYDPAKWEEDMTDFFVMMKGRLPIILTPRKRELGHAE